MSVLRRTVILLSLTILLLVGLAATALSISTRSGDGEIREIVLVARDMAFYRPGDGVPNPTLRVAPDRSVRLTLINGDPGVIHDLVVESLGWTLGRVREKGSSVSAVLRTPSTPGAHEYACSLHPVTMRGSIEIEAPGVGTRTSRSEMRFDSGDRGSGTAE